MLTTVIEHMTKRVMSCVTLCIGLVAAGTISGVSFTTVNEVMASFVNRISRLVRDMAMRTVNFTFMTVVVNARSYRNARNVQEIAQIQVNCIINIRNNQIFVSRADLKPFSCRVALHGLEVQSLQVRGQHVRLNVLKPSF